MYSQNNEEEVILNYFKGYKGTFLDIGAYDGVELSNTRALAELGWKGVCVEPNPKVFERLLDNCEGFKVDCANYAIGTENGYMEMYMNDTYYSTLKKSEVDRWKKTDFKFESVMVEVLTFKTFDDFINIPTYEFISIDCEGLDYEVLTQIDLDEVGNRMVCVETNGKETQKYIDYISKFGYKVLHLNAENLIMAR